MLALLLALLACSGSDPDSATTHDTGCCIVCTSSEQACGTGCIDQGDQCNQPAGCACTEEEAGG